MAMTRARWCQTTTGAGWPGEYRFLLRPLPSQSDFLTPLLPGHPHHIALVSRALEPSILSLEALPDSKEPSVGRCRERRSTSCTKFRSGTKFDCMSASRWEWWWWEEEKKFWPNETPECAHDCM